MVIVLFDRMDPESLKHFLAIVGSFVKGSVLARWR
jgi:hypothetical protein